VNLIGSYNYALVALSVLIAMFASYAALDLAGRVTAAGGWTRAVWLLGGAGAMGTGIWSMHYIGMLAFVLPIAVAYHWPTVLLSLFAAILASIIALYVVSQQKMGASRALAGSVLMGAGIASMHYIGMAAMRLPAVCEFNSFLVVLSVVFAVLISLAALWITFHFRDEKTGIGWGKTAGAVVMGGAIPVMHYTGMAAASFTPSGMPADMSHAVSISALGTAGIAAVTFIVLGLALLTSWMDRRFAAQALELQEEKLQRSEAYLAEAQRLSHTGSFGWRPSTGEILWSEETFRIFKYDRATKPTVELVLQRVDPDDAALVKQTIERASQDGKDFEYECRLVMPDGSVKYVHVMAHALNDESDGLEFVGAVMDVTAAKQAEGRIRQIIDTIPAYAWSTLPDGSVDFINQRFLEFTGRSNEELLGWGWRSTHHPDDMPREVGVWRAALAAGEPMESEVRVRGRDGDYRWLLIRNVPLRDELGNIVKWYGTAIEIEDRKRAEVLLAGEKRLLEMIARGDSRAFTLDALCRLVEELASGSLSSILLLDPNANCLRHGAAPSLPITYTQAIDGAVVGPSVGSCGTAAYRGEPVIVSDIATDPLWADYRDLASAHGLRACWSTPVLSSAGRVLGAFAIYYREPRSPTPQEQNVIERITHLASIAIERDRAVEALRRSESNLAEAQSLTHTGSWAWRVAGREAVHLSEEWYRIYGFDPEEGMPTWEQRLQRVHPEDRPKWRETINRAIAEKSDYEVEFRILLPGGTVKYIHTVGHPVLNASGDLMEFVGSATDITERKQAVEALRRSESYLAEAQKLAHTGSWAWQVTGREALHLSEEWYRIYGFDPEEGLSAWEKRLQRTNPEDRAKWQAAVDRAIREKSDYEVEVRIVLPDGTVKYIHAVGHPVLNAAGDVVQFVGNSTDVTERKRADEERERLLASERASFAEAVAAQQRFRDLVNSVEGIVWEADVPSFQFLFISKQAERVLGYPVERWLSEPTFWKDHVHPDDRDWALQFCQSATTEKRDHEFEYRMIAADGSVVWLRDLVTVVVEGDRVTRLRGVMVDLTKRKQAEEALRQAQADLAHVSRVTTMGELTASLAHEVNQPIAAAVTNANTSLRWLAANPPNVEEARAAATRIVIDGRRAGEIISRIRLLFKKGTPQHDLVDVNEVIGEMIVLLRGETTRYSISVRTELAADLPQVRGDRVQLLQVMMNLIMNSIDAMKDVDDTRELVIKSQNSENEHLLVSVGDTGVGLPPQQADQIFNAFFTTKPNGTGMGLRISRSIIESHGGRLWAANNSPRGASFCFTLPTKV